MSVLGVWGGSECIDQCVFSIILHNTHCVDPANDSQIGRHSRNQETRKLTHTSLTGLY